MFHMLFIDIRVHTHHRFDQFYQILNDFLNQNIQSSNHLGEFFQQKHGGHMLCDFRYLSL